MADRFTLERHVLGDIFRLPLHVKIATDIDTRINILREHTGLHGEATKNILGEFFFGLELGLHYRRNSFRVKMKRLKVSYRSCLPWPHKAKPLVGEGTPPPHSSPVDASDRCSWTFVWILDI